MQMQNFIPSYMKGGTYPVRTIFSVPKFVGCIDYLIFLLIVLPARASRARELRYKTKRSHQKLNVTYYFLLPGQYEPHRKLLYHVLEIYRTHTGVGVVVQVQ